MANIADAIVLSSSPNQLRSPRPVLQDANVVSRTMPRSTSPTPTSVTKIKPQTRSRFFPTPIACDKKTENDKQPKKRAPKKPAQPKNDDSGASSKLRRKAQSTDDGATIAPGCSTAEGVGAKENTAKPTRGRPRKTAKSKDAGNMTLSGKITKNSGDPPRKATKASKKMVGDTLPSPNDKPEESVSKAPNALGKDEVLHLDEAIRRRLDWTPPRDTAASEVVAPMEESSQPNESRDSSAIVGFGNLLCDYNYSGVASNPRDLVQNSNSEGPTKRRRIDLVDPLVQSLLNGNSGSKESTSASDQDVAGKSKKTAKSKPKRFTTLTARMTAQYAVNDEEEEETATNWVPEVKTAKRKRKAKEPAEESPYTVLPPEAAVAFSNDQDFMFGTCSQLEREDSPQTLREMQQAIRASENLSYSEGMHDPSIKVLQESSVRSVSKMTGTRNLWCVAARDTEGSLIRPKSLNVVDLTDQTEVPLTNGSAQVEKAPHKSLPQDWFEHDFVDIDSPPEKRAMPSKTSDHVSTSTQQAQASSLSQVPAPAPVPSLPALATKPTKPTKPTKKGDVKPTGPVDSQPTVSQAPSMPQYSGFTDSELSKQVSTFGFKSVRGRKKMIELLQQCWESKHGITVTPDCHSASQPEQEKALTLEKSNKSKSASESKPKAKPKPKKAAPTKAGKILDVTTPACTLGANIQTSSQKPPGSQLIPKTSASFIDIEEIQDSEEEITPSPSRVQKHYDAIHATNKAGSRLPEHSLDILTKTPPQSPAKRKTVSKISVTKKTSRAVKSSEPIRLEDISAHITKAVRIQPQLSRSSSFPGSRIQPTWHEKILMYDPIVLEDFTAWLNTEGFALVGEDHEVGTGSIREWCESKGICCCWKKNASW